MSPLELNGPITVCSEQCNFVVSQDKAFIIVFMNMLKIQKEDMNESINKIYENTNQKQKEIDKTITEAKMEID